MTLSWEMRRSILLISPTAMQSLDSCNGNINIVFVNLTAVKSEYWNGRFPRAIDIFAMKQKSLFHKATYVVGGDVISNPQKLIF